MIRCLLLHQVVDVVGGDTAEKYVEFVDDRKNVHVVVTSKFNDLVDRVVRVDGDSQCSLFIDDISVDFIGAVKNQIFHRHHTEEAILVVDDEDMVGIVQASLSLHLFEPFDGVAHRFIDIGFEELRLHVGTCFILVVTDEFADDFALFGIDFVQNLFGLLFVDLFDLLDDIGCIIGVHLLDNLCQLFGIDRFEGILLGIFGEFRKGFGFQIFGK